MSLNSDSFLRDPKFYAGKCLNLKKKTKNRSVLTILFNQERHPVLVLAVLVLVLTLLLLILAAPWRETVRDLTREILGRITLP